MAAGFAQGLAGGLQFGLQLGMRAAARKADENRAEQREKEAVQKKTNAKATANQKAAANFFKSYEGEQTKLMEQEQRIIASDKYTNDQKAIALNKVHANMDKKYTQYKTFSESQGMPFDVPYQSQGDVSVHDGLVLNAEQKAQLDSGKAKVENKHFKPINPDGTFDDGVLLPSANEMWVQKEDKAPETVIVQNKKTGEKQVVDKETAKKLQATDRFFLADKETSVVYDFSGNPKTVGAEEKASLMAKGMHTEEKPMIPDTPMDLKNTEIGAAYEEAFGGEGLMGIGFNQKEALALDYALRKIGVMDPNKIPKTILNLKSDSWFSDFDLDSISPENFGKFKDNQKAQIKSALDYVNGKKVEIMIIDDKTGRSQSMFVDKKSADSYVEKYKKTKGKSVTIQNFDLG